MINAKIKAVIGSLYKLDDRLEIFFRYSDLSRAGQIKLVKLIKAKSRVLTVRKLRHREIDEAFELADPIIFQNWRTGFNGGQFPAYREVQLSSLAYHMNKKNLNRDSLNRILRACNRDMSGSQRDELVNPQPIRQEAFDQRIITGIRMPEFVPTPSGFGTMESILSNNN